MKKLSFKELVSKIWRHNEEKGITTQYQDNEPLQCVVVIDNVSFDKEYPIESRSYKFRSDNKYFLSNMGGNSIFAESLDGSDRVRLDWYLSGKDAWKVEYCYILNEKL